MDKHLQTGRFLEREVFCSANANTWEEITLQFTPTQSGIIDVFAEAYGGTTYTGYVSDLTLPSNIATKTLNYDFGGSAFSSNAGDTSSGSIPTFSYFGG